MRPRILLSLVPVLVFLGLSRIAPPWLAIAGGFAASPLADERQEHVVGRSSSGRLHRPPLFMSPPRTRTRRPRRGEAARPRPPTLQRPSPAELRPAPSPASRPL